VADDVRLVQSAVDLGVAIFDTADAYGAGASEHVLGRALRRRRDEVTIATKGGFAFRSRSLGEQWARRWSRPLVERVRRREEGGAAAPAPASTYARQDFSPRHLRNAVHSSLRRLCTDRIDLYQLHGPRELLPDLLDQLSDLVAVGDVVRFGVGARDVAMADEWIPVRGVSAVQVPFGILDPEAASTTLSLARDNDREVWGRGVFGGGLLALAERDPAALLAHPKRRLVQALRQIADDAGLDQYELAMAFVRAHADVGVVLVGSTKVEHVRRNVELLAAPPLDGETLRAVRDAASAAQELM
jgi:aryl-alcohol dehydrogenase-like predicted oxidoreductase